MTYRPPCYVMMTTDDDRIMAFLLWDFAPPIFYFKSFEVRGLFLGTHDEVILILVLLSLSWRKRCVLRAWIWVAIWKDKRARRHAQKAQRGSPPPSQKNHYAMVHLQVYVVADEGRFIPQLLRIASRLCPALSIVS